MYDVLDNNRKSKLYSFFYLKGIFIKTGCFKILKIKENAIKLLKKFYDSKFFNNIEKNYIKYLLKIIEIST